MAFRKMSRETLHEKIKEINALRARCKHDFDEIKKKHEHHDISDKEFQKHQDHFQKRYEKYRKQIQDVEHQLCKLDASEK